MFGFTKRPLFLIAWKNLRTYPVRIFLTTSSIILGVAVIIASNIFSESNKSAFDNLFTGIYEGVDLVVQPIQEDFAQGFSGDGGQGPISFEVKKIPDEKIQEMITSSNKKAETDKDFRALKEHIVESERAIYAIEEALKTDSSELLNQTEIDLINLLIISPLN